jgi:hypothetical protein
VATRIRRGKEVEIPPQWEGQFPTKKTMRDRPSRMKHKLRRSLSSKAKLRDAKDIPLE